MIPTDSHKDPPSVFRIHPYCLEIDTMEILAFSPKPSELGRITL